MRKENLLIETIEKLQSYNKKTDDVLWISCLDKAGDIIYFSWEEFSDVAAFWYNAGNDFQKINAHLEIVGENWWLERHEYDGSEWWEFKTLPKKPELHKAPTKEDLLENQ